MRRRIHTLNTDDDHRPNMESSSGESGDEGNRPRRPQEYYVGGSTTTGQQVIDPHYPLPESTNTRLNRGGNRPATGEVIRVNVEMFDNGFTVDNSALRSYDDPANIAFIDTLKRRETPPELLLKHGNRPIDVHCFKKPGNYVFKPFSGAGYRLGGVPRKNSGG